MSKKHFEAMAEALARELNHAMNSDNPAAAMRAVRDCAQAMAGVCAEHNPRFDSHRFLKAVEDKAAAFVAVQNQWVS